MFNLLVSVRGLFLFSNFNELTEIRILKFTTTGAGQYILSSKRKLASS
jgi:hypothetical protein